MIGKFVPVTGAETLSCRSTRRSGYGSVIGWTEMIGVDDEVGMLAAFPIKA